MSDDMSAGYLAWNRAIAAHVVQGQPRDAFVFLAIDDEELAIIGGESFHLTCAESAVEAFRSAVTTLRRRLQKN